MREGFHFATDYGDYISGIGGAFLFLIFVFYMIHLTIRAKDNKDKVETFNEMKIPKAILLALVGLAGLTIGGELIVKSATRMAQDLGVSDAIIGLTIVALGTSLPELATSVIAATKHNCDLALGNVIGSNIFNIFFVLSISSMVHPLQAYPGLWLDALMAFAGPAMTWIYVHNGKNHTISRWEGVSLLVIYAIYLTYRIIALP